MNDVEKNKILTWRKVDRENNNNNKLIQKEYTKKEKEYLNKYLNISKNILNKEKLYEIINKFDFNEQLILSEILHLLEEQYENEKNEKQINNHNLTTNKSIFIPYKTNFGIMKSVYNLKKEKKPSKKILSKDKIVYKYENNKLLNNETNSNESINKEVEISDNLVYTKRFSNFNKIIEDYKSKIYKKDNNNYIYKKINKNKFQKLWDKNENKHYNNDIISHKYFNSKKVSNNNNTLNNNTHNNNINNKQNNFIKENVLNLEYNLLNNQILNNKEKNISFEISNQCQINIESICKKSEKNKEAELNENKKEENFGINNNVKKENELKNINKNFNLINKRYNNNKIEQYKDIINNNNKNKINIENTKINNNNYINLNINNLYSSMNINNYYNNNYNNNFLNNNKNYFYNKSTITNNNNYNNVNININNMNKNIHSINAINTINTSNNYNNILLNKKIGIPLYFYPYCLKTNNIMMSHYININNNINNNFFINSYYNPQMIHMYYQGLNDYNSNNEKAKYFNNLNKNFIYNNIMTPTNPNFYNLLKKKIGINFIPIFNNNKING